MKKTLTAVFLCLILILSGCGMSGDGSKTAITIQKGEETMMEISSSYVWLYTLMYKDQYEAFFGPDFWEQEAEDGRTNEEFYMEDMYDEIVHMKLASIAAQEEGVSLTSEEVEFCKENAAEFIDTIDKGTQKKTGIDEEVYARFEEDFALYEKYKTEFLVDKEARVDEEGLRQSDLFILPFYTYEVTETGEITEYDDTKRAEVKQKAEEAYAMLQAGQSTEEVAIAFEMDPQECMYVIGRTPTDEQDEYYDAAFENAAFSLKEGEYSPVTECSDGYYIFYMISEINEVETEAVIEYNRQEVLEALFNSHINDMTEEYQLMKNEEEWEKITFTADISFVEEE